MAFLVVPALCGCVPGGGVLSVAIPEPESVAARAAGLPFPGDLPLLVGAVPIAPVEEGGDPWFPGGSASIGTAATRLRAGPAAEPAGRPSGFIAGAGMADDGATDRARLPAGSAVEAGSGPGGPSGTERFLDNAQAADLEDHWGHRQVQGVVEGLSLGTAARAADGAGMRGLEPDALSGAGERLACELEDGDEVRLLGARHGVTYGRWSGGPADTLSIDFDLSRAGPEMRDDPAFLALLERAGKAWSRRVADSWPAWDRPSGDFKGRLRNDGVLEDRVFVGPEGETSDRLEVHVKDNDLATFAGRASGWGKRAPGGSWERRFGTVQIERDTLRDASERSLFTVLVHELGHVIGSWAAGTRPPEHIEALVDRDAGTWTGPNVVAVHGGPAPFQDKDDPYAWIDGERSPLATEFDFAHSGVCRSIMAYCSRNEPRRVILPHDIDFAFLADAGMSVTEETERPETYGLAGWTDHAGFFVSVSRDLEIALDYEGLRGERGARHPTELDVTDWLEVRVDTFGDRSFGNPLRSFPAEDRMGTVRYAGGLLGAAIGRAGLPPVTGDATLAVNLGTFDGEASFTSLAVHAGGAPEIFAGGNLHYPFDLEGNAIAGTGTESTLRARFYGPGHQEVAGTLDDRSAGLLASFGAARDDRPSREEVVASADYLAGSSYGEGVAGLAGAGWSRYRCDAAAGCESGRAGSVGGTEWTASTRSAVLEATAGWGWRSRERPYADRGFVRIARQSAPYTENPLTPGRVRSQTGTLAHVAFGNGFEWSADLSAIAENAFPVAGDDYRIWTGIQGTRSGSRPDGSARWSGPMLGYQGGRHAGETPFVEGLASIEFSFVDGLVDVAFSEVASRDGARDVPDFAYEDLALDEDGTFGWTGAAGTMDGALFGPGHEEAGGAFHHGTTDVTGSFGARRVPAAVVPGERGPAAPPPPVVQLRDDSWNGPRTTHVGADAAAPRDDLAAGGERGGVAVASGEVVDGQSAGRVVEYLRQQIGSQGGGGARTPGLATLPGPPTVRLAEGTSAELAAYVEHAVQLINTSLPAGKRILSSPEPAPPLTALEAVPDGEVFVDFAPSADDWQLGGRYETTWTDHEGRRIMVGEVDPIAERNPATRRWELTGMRAGRIWFDREVVENNLNMAHVRNWETDVWDVEALESRPDESDSQQPYYRDDYLPRITVFVLLRALGLLRRVDPVEFPDSFVREHGNARIRHLPDIDGEALVAAYDRLAPGTLPEDLTPESLGPWDRTSFHLRGDLDVADGEAAFGVAFRNGFARPWAAGTAPMSELENNTALFGTASWNGALLGFTPAAETVAGEARLVVELRTLDAELAFNDLERWEVEAAPGAAGTGTRWGDGDLAYSVAIRGNSFHRTGGDDGEVVGAFFGPAHDAMGGVLERSDLSAGFGGTR